MLKNQSLGNIFKSFLSFILIIFVSIGSVSADDNDGSDPFARFGEYTDGSDLTIYHGVWDNILTTTVVVIPPSTRKMSGVARKPKTGTKISRGSTSAARFESNRVVFHLLEEDHLNRITKYRQELEKLPDQYPLSEFKQNEQLAYWLNLHNVLVYEKMAERYPFSTLKKLREKKKGGNAFWDQKLVTIEGVPLSLNDIQNKILIRHWKSPLVLYGLYQGAIGGPSLSNRAFTGQNVYSILRDKADEFINSNRGFKGQQVSLLYAWGKAAFPDWQNDLARHLKSFAKPNFQASLSSSEPFTTGLYDWNIADILGGTLSAGPKDDTAVNLLAAGGSGTQGLLNELYRSGKIGRGAFNQHTLDLLGAIQQKRAEMPEREGIVSSEECGVDDCPELENEENAPEELPEEKPDDESGPEGAKKD